MSRWDPRGTAEQERLLQRPQWAGERAPGCRLSAAPGATAFCAWWRTAAADTVNRPEKGAAAREGGREKDCVGPLDLTLHFCSVNFSSLSLAILHPQKAWLLWFCAAEVHFTSKAWELFHFQTLRVYGAGVENELWEIMGMILHMWLRLRSWVFNTAERTPNWGLRTIRWMP